MHLFLSILCSFFMLASVGQKSSDDLILIANPNDKNICIIKLNSKYYLTNISDVRLINNRIVESIEMFLPDNMFFKKVKGKYPKQSNNIQAVFVIKTIKGGMLPKKFVTDEMKRN